MYNILLNIAPQIFTTMAFRKIEEYDPQATEELAVHYKEVLRLLGEDPEREGLQKTPERVAKSMQFLTQGYHMDGAEILRSAMFKEDYRQMVVVKDIELYSMCEHHLLPFYGKAHVAYIPNGYITGGGMLCPAPAGAGASHRPDKGLHTGHTAPSRSGSSHRGLAHVHADPRCAETELHHHHLGVHRRIPEGRAHPQRVHAPDRSVATLVS